jgi:hypothetical protein
LGDTGFERDTGRSKIGDGVKAWNDMKYFNEVGAGGGGRLSTTPVEFGDPVTAKLRYEIIPDGGFGQLFFDDFEVNTLGTVSRYPFGARAYSIVSGELTAGVTPLLETAATFINGRVTIKGTTTPPALPGFRKKVNSDSLIATPDGLYKHVDAVYTKLLSWVAPTIGDYNSLEIVDNIVVHKRWIGDPLGGSVVRSTFSYTLVGTNAEMFGLGVEKYGAVFGNDSGHKGDNLRVEEVVGEQRRLMADIDRPTGGVTSTVIASA